jgi:glycosyltransferase involved in cell wall biosynthesis
MTVAVVVPAYNESGYVGNVIDGLPDFVDRAYVVDDGSTDDTWDEITSHAAHRNAVHDGRFDDLVVPIQHEHNRGVGGAIKTGYCRARDEGIDATAVLGGDDQMDPAVLKRYLDPIADGVADYTKGNRFADPDYWSEMPRFRLIGNVTLSYLTKIASGYWGSMDSQNGYTAISREALERTDIDDMYEFYGYCNDLLVRLNAADVEIADVDHSADYGYSDDWKSHIEYKEYVPKVSAMLLRSWLWRLRRKYIMTRFEPIAPLYLLGSSAMSVSALGFLDSVVRRNGQDSGSWAVAVVLGALTFLYAAMRDGDDNADLVTGVDGTTEDPREETEEDAVPADDLTPVAAGPLGEAISNGESHPRTSANSRRLIGTGPSDEEQ